MSQFDATDVTAAIGISLVQWRIETLICFNFRNVSGLITHDWTCAQIAEVVRLSHCVTCTFSQYAEVSLLQLNWTTCRLF